MIDIKLMAFIDRNQTCLFIRLTTKVFYSSFKLNLIFFSICFKLRYYLFNKFTKKKLILIKFFTLSLGINSIKIFYFINSFILLLF